MDIRKISSISLAAFIAAFSSPQLQAELSPRITPTADVGFLDGSNKVLSYDLTAEVGTSGEGSAWMSMLKFHLRFLEQEQVYINNAYLQLTVSHNHNYTQGGWYDVYGSTNDNWGEGSPNGINRPHDDTLTLQDSVYVDRHNTVYQWDVYDALVGESGLGGDNEWLSFLLTPDLTQTADEYYGVHFYDRSVQEFTPLLMVNISPVPELSSTWMMGAGVLILSALGRIGRRRKTL